MSRLTAAQLAEALRTGERAAFHGPPAAGVAPLRAALAADPDQPRLRWLLGVCLGALGHYADAADVLRPGLDPGAAADSLAASARASHLRQLERHAEAEELDQLALRLASRPAAADPAGADPAGAGARADALVGLVADAVGRHDAATARSRLAAATDQLGAGAPAAPGWRAGVRLAWVATEVALLTGQPAQAAEHAAGAVRGSAAAGAPRHLAKSLLFRGVAEEVLGDPAAAVTLDEAARRAEDLGLLPLVWPARLVRSRILARTDPEAAQSDLAVARTAMRAITVRLAADMSSAVLTQTGWN